jgi:hypothetical protein
MAREEEKQLEILKQKLALVKQEYAAFQFVQDVERELEI